MNKVRLKDICLITSSKRIFEKEYVSEGIPFIRGQEITDGSLLKSNIKFECYISKKRFEEIKEKYIIPKKHDILITAVGTIGNVCYLDKDVEFYFKDGNILHLTNFNEKVYPLYLYYYMKSDFFHKQINVSMIGAVQKALTIKMLSNILIEIPSLEEQKKIVTILSFIDKKIELNNKINIELEAMAKTIYDYWFLQFEFPNEEGKPYKLSGGKMVWNKKLKREIPEGWVNGYLKEYIKNQKAGDWGKEQAIGNYQKEVTCIRGADFSSITSFDKVDMPRRFILEKNSFKLLSAYDLLIEISGGSPIQSTGRICYINDAVLKRFSTELITSNFCKAISLTDNSYFYWFYMLWKTLYINNVFFNYESKTTGIKNLLFDIMCEKYPICKPPIQIIKLYNQQVTPYFNKIQQNIIENQELISLRDFLLPLLMNGQVGFKEDKAEG